MTGCIFKRKLKSGVSRGCHLFFAGWTADGKRNQILSLDLPRRAPQRRHYGPRSLNTSRTMGASQRT